MILFLMGQTDFNTGEFLSPPGKGEYYDLEI